MCCRKFIYVFYNFISNIYLSLCLFRGKQKIRLLLYTKFRNQTVLWGPRGPGRTGGPKKSMNSDVGPTYEHYMGPTSTVHVGPAMNSMWVPQ